MIRGVLAALPALEDDRAVVKMTLGALSTLMAKYDDDRARVVAGGGSRA